MSQTSAQLISGKSDQSVTFNDATVSSLNGGALAGMRNRIINGGMDFWQRGTSTGSVSGTTATYMVDRFYGYAGSGNITISRSTDVPAKFQYSCSMVGTGVSITQRIESVNCIDLSGATVTVSFWAKSTSGTDNLIVSLYTATGGTDNYSSQTSTVNTVSASPSSSWTYYTTTFTGIPATATNGVGIGIGRGSGGSSTTLITGVQLEPGSVATPFERRSFGAELALCQRYYEKGSGVLLAVYSAGPFGGGTTTYQFKATKRVSPTTITVAAGTGVGLVTTFNTVSPEDRLSVWWNGNAVQGDYREFTFTASSEL